ncbi:hypothetical protein H4Q26_003388 [Puccinia striiformis f. sp. tritici PST-130]|nr:hypothetical protein H4Q26_003388 [Puccinia striiformis f. sp. tritici PST-130]
MRPLSKANLLPLSDPEAIIRAANAARRHLTQPIRRTQTSSMSDSPGNTTNIPHLPDDSYRGWFRLVLKTQHAALVQSKLDREAAREAAEDNTVRIRRLEDLVMALALKSDKPAPTGRSNNAELDLQRFLQEALAKDGLFDYAFEDTEGCYGHLDAAAIAGLEEMHVQRWKNEDEKAEEDAKDWAENFADEVATS